MNNQLSLLDRAMLLAVNAHAGALRRDGTTPYILHCTETASITATMTVDQEVLSAAVLHDVLEDTEVTEAQLKEEFGPRVTELVRNMSENKRSSLPPESTWLVRKEETLSAMEHSTDLDFKRICLADKLSNLRGIYRDYRSYGDDIWDFFHQKSKSKQGWYYFRIESALAPLQNTDAWKEFHELRLNIFG